MRAMSIFVIFLSTMGCGAQTVQDAPIEVAHVEPVVTDDDDEFEPESALVNMSFTAAPVTDMIRALSLATGETIVIGPRALPVAECAEISIYSPSAIRPGRLFELVRPVLERAGLELEQTEAGAFLTLIEGAEPFPECDRRARRARASAATPPTSPSPTLSAAHKQEILDSVTFESTHTHKISSKARDLIFTNAAAIIQSVRVLPFEENGKVLGVKIYAVRRGSVMGKLGFLNGDVLLKVNGHDFSTPKLALKTYSAIRSVDEVVVDLLRRSKHIKFRYRIVGEKAQP